MARTKQPKTADEVAQVREAEARLARVVQAARVALGKKRQTRGAAAGDVTQEDVDAAADALVAAGVRPYPQLITRISGGSLSTVGEKFDDWWARFAARRLDPDQPGLDVPLRIALRVRHLIAGLEAAVREQLRDRVEPSDIVLAAAELGERQALRAQIAALEATREKLTAHLAALTFKVGELEAQLNTQAAMRQTTTTALDAAVGQLTETLHRLQTRLDREDANADQQLLAAIRRLRTQLAAQRGTGPASALRPRATRTRAAARSRPGRVKRVFRKPRRRAADIRGARRPPPRRKR